MEEKYRGPERRKSSRKEGKLKIEYVLEDELESKKILKLRSTYSANIGGGGLCMCIDEDISLKEGNQLYLIITLPNQKKIFVPSQAIYIKPNLRQGYRVGLRYLDMSVEDKLAMISFNAEFFPDIIEKIRKKAYELYEKRGYIHGHDWEDWFVATKLILNS